MRDYDNIRRLCNKNSFTIADLDQFKYLYNEYMNSTVLMNMGSQINLRHHMNMFKCNERKMLDIIEVQMNIDVYLFNEINDIHIKVFLKELNEMI